jgi:putative aminopeptidase FrvX
MDSLSLIKEFVSIPGPPGQEHLIRDSVAAHASALGFSSTTDPKGNLLIPVNPDVEEPAKIVVTAHLDEIAVMISRIEPDGRIKVAPLGGTYAWKWGEGPVELMAGGGFVPGILSFGSIHTNSSQSVAQQAREKPLTWDMAYVFTGLSADQLVGRGVRPGTRVVLSRDRRSVRQLEGYVTSYFLDDRADLAAMILAAESLKKNLPKVNVLFAATVYEETGGEGARYLMQQVQPDVCIALEIGPSVPESPFVPDSQPTIWVQDGYSTMTAADIDLLESVTHDLGQKPHWQALSRGGSDATCTAALGLCARPITLGLPVENSHGFEIMHKNAPAELARLLTALIPRLV